MITKIQVKNYRSLGEINLNLGQLTVLVGPNGSGKSNLIDVLRFVAEVLQYGLDAALTKRHGIDMLRRWSLKKPYDLCMEFEINNQKKDHLFEATYGFELKSERDSKISVKKEYCLIKWKNQTAEYQYEKGVPVKPVSTGLSPQVDADS